MKSPISSPAQAARSLRGFTLIELLLVITIIAILAALTISGMGYAQQASSRNRTLASMASIKTGLEAYKEKFGDYPTPKSPTDTSSFGAKTFISGGAKMLYQALSGDGTDAIDLGASGASSTPSDGKVDTDEANNKVVFELPRSMVYHATGSTDYVLVDGFGRPFQYQKGDANTTGAAVTTINSSSYDLWSYGSAPESSIPTGAMPSLSEKQSDSGAPKASDAWIKNW
jgi:prepilin-type N-terminal cleavage/methylation domain-containing protein